MDKLQLVRNKILDRLVWATEPLDTPIVFSKYLVKVLLEADMLALEVAEQVDPRSMDEWYADLFKEVATRQRAFLKSNVG